jgi:hypothetical protein
VAGFEVYLPDDTTAMFASSREPMRACSTNGAGIDAIDPIQPGP